MDGITSMFLHKEAIAFWGGGKISKSTKMVLEGANWVSRAVLSPDNNDLGIF